MRLVVIGGGIAGLAAAHRAVELARERSIPLDLTVLEARDRLGGTIETERAGGFLIEAGPDSFLSEKPWALALCRRLGLEPRLVGTDDRFRRTFVWFRGRLHPLPEGFQLLAPTRLRPFLASRLLSWPGKARMALDVILPRGAAGDDESLGAFVRRRLGREALERVAQPLVAGIYTADPEELSLRATMPRFLELERAQRSLIIGLWRASRGGPAASGTSGARWSLFVTLSDGMGELVHALAARLPAGAVHLKRRVTGVVRRAAAWAVDGGGPTVEADRVIVAVEAHAASRLLRYVDPSLTTLLQVIPYASSATVSLGYQRAAIRHPLDGFGFVVPRVEGQALLACTFSSVKYPGRAPDGHVLLRCFLGGALNAGILERDDDELVRLAGQELAAALGLVGEPILIRVARHPAAMPQYVIGHLRTLEAIDQRLQAAPGLYLAGSAYRGIGIADCVRSGEAAAERALLGDAGRVTQ
ncbi:MAG TPA: protoporphyrinogen oxidase [Methylomirabilota bacterium]|nr:protoporphyrinogen oxidase [Methylomirabilota bacterium]